MIQIPSFLNDSIFDTFNDLLNFIIRYTAEHKLFINFNGFQSKLRWMKCYYFICRKDIFLFFAYFEHHLLLCFCLIFKFVCEVNSLLACITIIFFEFDFEFLSVFFLVWSFNNWLIFFNYCLLSLHWAFILFLLNFIVLLFLLQNGIHFQNIFIKLLVVNFLQLISWFLIF